MNTFKTLLLNSFSSVKSIGQNCEQDNIDCLSNLKIFLTNKSLSELNTTDIAVPFNNELKSQVQTNKLIKVRQYTKKKCA